MPSGTQPLLLAREPQGVDQIVEVAVQHLGEVVDRVVDAVVGDAVLGKVVGANLGRTVPRAHLRPALARSGRFLLGDHLVEQARAQHLERLDLVLELTLLVLTLDDEIGRQVGDAHGAVGRVDALAARSLRAEDIDPEVLVFDLHVDLLRFGEHGHCARSPAGRSRSPSALASCDSAVSGPGGPSRAWASPPASRSSRSCVWRIWSSRACSRPNCLSLAGFRAVSGSASSRATSSARVSAWRSRASTR